MMLFIRYFIVIPFFLYPEMPQGQSITPDVISGSGGDHTRDGYQISWTLGELVAESRAISGHIFSQGFQQADPTNIQAVYTIDGETIPTGSAVCFDALMTLNILNFTLQNGANAQLLAGHNIKILPITYIRQGASMSARIKEDLIFCTIQGDHFLAAKTEGDNELKDEKADIRAITNPVSCPILIYPNPSPGLFSVEWKDNEEGSIIINIIDMLGKTITSISQSERFTATVDLSSAPAGIYLLQFIRNGNIESARIIRY